MNKTGDQDFLLKRSLVLIGMPGAGKTTIGRHLATHCGLPFRDADRAIEEASGARVGEIFAQQGEPAFRALERDMIARLLQQGPLILSPGGGAFIDPQTRETVKASGALSLWLKVERGVLLERVTRNRKRPLLRDDPAGALDRLLAEREPVYRQADVTIECDDGPVEKNIDKILALLRGL